MSDLFKIFIISVIVGSILMTISHFIYPEVKKSAYLTVISLVSLLIGVGLFYIYRFISKQTGKKKL